MDKKIVKKKWTIKRIVIYSLVAILTLYILNKVIFGDRRSKLYVDEERLTIEEVVKGEFNEFIPNTGTVIPSRTVYLDAVEGGTIKRIVKESGAVVKSGDVIIELSNLNRELAVLGQEASLNESINRARETRLNIMRNDLEQRLTLAQIDNQLAILEPFYQRQKNLFDKGFISQQDFERAQADYEYNVTRKRITYEVYKNDSLDRVRQLKAVSRSESKMTQSLNGVGRILDNLIIRSPINGQLSTPHWEVGQSVTQGQRLGQVDILGAYKVRVPIDELYLPKISAGLPAYTTFDGQEYELTIEYIYPTVTNGRFEVDMNFSGEVPDGIRRGQSLRLRIVLGKPSIQILLPVGGFYQDTGGNWVYLLEDDSKAVKREIKLGRRNSEHYEVIEGLNPGDRVITSSYKNFGSNDVLLIK